MSKIDINNVDEEVKVVETESNGVDVCSEGTGEGEGSGDEGGEDPTNPNPNPDDDPDGDEENLPGGEEDEDVPDGGDDDGNNNTGIRPGAGTGMTGPTRP